MLASAPQTVVAFAFVLHPWSAEVHRKTQSSSFAREGELHKSANVFRSGVE